MTVKIKQHYGGISMNENAIRKLADSDERLNIRLLNDFAFKTTFHNKAALTGAQCIIGYRSSRYPEIRVHGFISSGRIC